jgi:PAS domain S-box-containing protein
MKSTEVSNHKPGKVTDKFFPDMQSRIAQLWKSGSFVFYTCKVTGDYSVTFISENVKRLIGYKPNDFINDLSFWKSRIHAGDLSRVMNNRKGLLEDGSHKHEYRFLHQNGIYRWVRDELKLIRNAVGIPIEIVGTWLDITESIENKEDENFKKISVVILTMVKSEEDILRSYNLQANCYDYKTHRS